VRYAVRKMMGIMLASALLLNLFSMASPGITSVNAAAEQKGIKNSSISVNGSVLKVMENKQATLELKTEQGSYFLPASQIDIDHIQKQLGTSVSLQDITIHIELAKPAQATTSIVENSAKKGNFTLVAPPVEFKVNASFQKQVVAVTSFSAYVQRQIALPEGNQRITTGIVVDSDGTVRPVPTKVIVLNGQYFAQISSLTNSTYAIVWNPIEFKDVADHWAKDAINDMGSRMIVNGQANGNFNPQGDMTRAEFVSTLVRALGLKPTDAKAPFSDVNQSDGYNGVINTAYTYHLINEFEEGTFKPNDKITREQAAMIISKAMVLTGLKEKLPLQEADELLLSFGMIEYSYWAKQGIADCLQAGILLGKGNWNLAIQANITRAEVAVMIKRLLEKSDFI